jgi:hypothetical protein
VKDAFLNRSKISAKVIPVSFSALLRKPGSNMTFFSSSSISKTTSSCKNCFDGFVLRRIENVGEDCTERNITVDSESVKLDHGVFTKIGAVFMQKCRHLIWIIVREDLQSISQFVLELSLRNFDLAETWSGWSNRLLACSELIQMLHSVVHNFVHVLPEVFCNTGVLFLQNHKATFALEKVRTSLRSFLLFKINGFCPSLTNAGL